MATLSIEIECDDDTDLSDGTFLLFGGADAEGDFGDWLNTHEFTVSRTG